MKSIVKAAGLTAVSCALLAGGAGAAGAHGGGASAQGAAVGSPGVISGNVVQIPVDVPINLCGDSINVVGLFNPANGNGCAQGVGKEGSKASKKGGKSAKGGKSGKAHSRHLGSHGHGH